jgi:hypothetical protein
MVMKLHATLILASLLPAFAHAQIRPTSAIAGALAIKAIPRANIVAATGTVISSVSAYNGVQCAEGCIVAKSGAGGKPALSLKFGDGSVRVEEVRTGVVISHDVSHSLRVTANGSELAGLLCNGHGAMVATPNFKALGATSSGFKWAIFDGAKMVSSSHSNGEAVKWNGDGHSAAPMQLAVFSDATIEITHGSIRLVMTSDDGQTIEAKNPWYTSI